MRPRKRVLLFCADPVRASVLRMALTVRLCAVEGFDSAAVLAQWIEWHPSDRFDAALVVGADAETPDQTELQVYRIAKRWPDVPIALLPARPRLLQTVAHVVLPVYAPIADVLEAVKVLCARKRGPKPLHGAETLRVKSETLQALARAREGERVGVSA